jgi:hypothetical protein
MTPSHYCSTLYNCRYDTIRYDTIRYDTQPACFLFSSLFIFIYLSCCCNIPITISLIRFLLLNVVVAIVTAGAIVTGM